MDEPLSNLDAKLRVEMRAYIARLHDELRATMVYVTHDQVEAMTMGDRVAEMRDGRLEKCDVPQVLYDRPANVFVAAIIGSPSMNLVRGRLAADADGLWLVLGDQRLRIPARPQLDPYLGGEILAGVRPEDFDRAGPGDADHVLSLPVRLTESMGSDLFVHAELDAPPVVAEEALEELGGADPVLPGGQTTAITARLAPDAVVATGQTLRLAVDVERIHFFDPQTEERI
jgi:multiple sugar transport system ATP-binding protein